VHLKISVRFFTILKEITGKKEEILVFQEGERVTINFVLKQLSEKYGAEFSNYVYDPKSREVKGYLQFFINGQSFVTLQGLESALIDGDVLAIVPPVSGG
jgi:MoaD family protein